VKGGANSHIFPFVPVDRFEHRLFILYISSQTSK